MKKNILVIIFIFIFFSNINISLAKKSGLIEDLLNLNYGPLTYDLSLEKLDNFNFENKKLKKIYSKLVVYDKIIRKKIIESNKLGEYDYYKTNGIIKNYKSFISYTNDFFYILKQIDKYPYLKEDIEIQNGILTTYKNSQSYYRKVKNLIID